MSLPERTDQIGSLARQLIGPVDGTPDMTAAIPLMDALLEAGDFDTAYVLSNIVCHWAQTLLPIPEDDRGSYMRQDMAGDMRNVLARELNHLTVDFNAACLALDAELRRESAPLETQESSVKALRIQMGFPVHLGMRITLPDGRLAIAISGTDEKGFVDVVIDEEAPASLGEGGVPTRPVSSAGFMADHRLGRRLR